MTSHSAFSSVAFWALRQSSIWSATIHRHSDGHLYCLGDGASRATEVDMAKKSETGSTLGEYARVVGELAGAEEESTPAKQAEADAQSETSRSREEPVDGSAAARRQ